MENKILNIKTLSNLVDSQYPTKELKLKIGEQEFVVNCQKYFKGSEIQELIKEWMKIKEATLENEIEVNMYDISFILVLKHFTDVPFEEIPNILERTEHYIRMTNLLIDLKDNEGVPLFNRIFEALDKEQLTKVTQSMDNASKIILQESQKLQESEQYKKLRDFVGKGEK